MVQMEDDVNMKVTSSEMTEYTYDDEGNMLTERHTIFIPSQTTTTYRGYIECGDHAYAFGDDDENGDTEDETVASLEASADITDVLHTALGVAAGMIVGDIILHMMRRLFK